jgi:hypothetical protein
LIAALAALPACSAIAKHLGPEAPAPDSAASQSALEIDDGRFTPWPDWLELGPRAFEERVEELAAREKPWRLSVSGLQQLVDALGQPGVPATRAAVLLAHAAAAAAAADEDEVDPGPREALLTRLERRAYAPSRSESAGDVIAAAALAAHTDEGKVSARLADLATGKRPHPELDVRVECACAALHGQRDEVVPFLLSVLRAETPAQGTIDWQRVTTLAWPKLRAADALAARAGQAHDYHPDASWQDQIDAAGRIEAALREAGVRR